MFIQLSGGGGGGDGGDGLWFESKLSDSKFLKRYIDT